MGLILVPRDLQTSVSNLGKDFTSFDRCMTRSICKIPFIIACVVGGLIALSLLICCIRCVMCGYACCACCCGGCGGRRRRRSKAPKYDTLPPPFAHQQQVPLAPPPQPIIIQQPIISKEPTMQEQPQYAYFESKTADSLPHMPSMQSERVAVETHEIKDMSGGQRGLVANGYDPDDTGVAKRVLSPAPSHYDYEPASPVSSYYHSPSYNHPSVLQPARLAAPPAPPQPLPPQHSFGGDIPASHHYEGEQYRENAYYDNPHTNRPPKEWVAV